VARIRILIAKEGVGRHHRAVSRNGLVLLMSQRPLAELDGAHVRLRLSIWHRAPLRSQPATPWGIVLCFRALHPSAASAGSTILRAETGRGHASDALLLIDLGGERVLNFSR